MKTPEFPPPDPRDAPEVAESLRVAAALWKNGRHHEALPHLMRAAAGAQQRSSAPKSDTRIVELAMAATELAAFVHSGEDPRSIPISLDFGSLDLESLPSAAIELIEPPRPPPAKLAHTLREEPRPSPDTKIVEPPAAPAPIAVDLSQTLPQGQKLENVPLIWQYAKKKPSSPAVPATKVLQEAPTTEPEPPSDPHGAPTRRMEDIDTKRDPGGDKR